MKFFYNKNYNKKKWQNKIENIKKLMKIKNKEK